MAKSISISNFDFHFTGHGHYKVVYTSPKTGNQWSVTTSDMHLIDCTKNAETPRTKDLTRLKELCKFNQY